MGKIGQYQTTAKNKKAQVECLILNAQSIWNEAVSLINWGIEAEWFINVSLN